MSNPIILINNNNKKKNEETHYIINDLNIIYITFFYFFFIIMKLFLKYNNYNFIPYTLTYLTNKYYEYKFIFQINNKLVSSIKSVIYLFF